MILPLALAAVMSIQGSSYDEIRRYQTGSNGYEEYVKAAMFLEDPVNRVYLSRIPREIPADDRTESANLARRLSKMPLLEFRRAVREKLSPALDLVRKGNLKAVFDPRQKVTPTTLYPELAQFRRLALLFCIDAWVALSEGQVARAWDDYAQALILAQKMANGFDLNGLFSDSITARVCDELLPLLNGIDVKGAERIIQMAWAAADGPANIIPSLLKTKEYIRSGVELAERPDEYVKALNTSDEYLGEGKKFVALPADQRNAVVARYLALADGYIDQMVGLLRRPESEWLRELPVPGSGESKAVLYLSIGLPEYSQVGMKAGFTRTKLRLVALTCMVELYRWNNGTFPSALSEAVPTARLTDPVSGKPFRFERVGAGFRIWSEGWPGRGEIELGIRDKEEDSPRQEPPINYRSSS